MRVVSREALGGHGVPEDKIRSRYQKCLALIPELVEISDIMHIYDNSTIPYRIFKKRKTEFFYWENDNWSEPSIRKLAGMN
jgi:predicted ABC-type ATPase